MIVEGSKTRPRTRQILAVALGMMLALVELSAVPAMADAARRRIIPLTLSKGQNYTISDVKKGTAPGIKVVKNPNALVVQTAPGRIELLGADSGAWNIKVTLASGEKVLYAVSVKAQGPPQGDLAPGSAPTAIR
jgi:hypothetical protein